MNVIEPINHMHFQKSCHYCSAVRGAFDQAQNFSELHKEVQSLTSELFSQIHNKPKIELNPDRQFIVSLPNLPTCVNC